MAKSDYGRFTLDIAGALQRLNARRPKNQKPFTRYQLARAAGITDGHLYNLEHTVARYDSGLLATLCGILECDIDGLLILEKSSSLRKAG